MALLGATLAAQTPIALTTPDGSRFLLCADATMEQVHWAVATWTSSADDPQALPGIGRAVVAAAQHGTWNTGSRDPERERQALTDLDAAWQRLPAQPDAQQLQRLQELGAAAAALADASMLPRLLAALPVHRCELEQRGPVAVLVLTTLAPALPEVAAMLLDRRERQALRELPTAWQRRGSDELGSLDAELLALTLPDHPFLRTAPPRPMPSRDEAFAAWARTQRPERTVHVLLGAFDPTVTTAVLQRTFARTELAASPPSTTTAPRPLAGLRRSQVPGVTPGAVRIGWPLPVDPNPCVLAAACHWFAEGPDSRLGQELRRTRPRAVVQSRAPWPMAIGGSGLFVLEITDPGGIDGLADAALQAVRTTLATAPTEAALQATLTTLQQRWRTEAADARRLATTIASTALQWPRSEPLVAWPDSIDGKALQALLQRTCLGQPAVVEGRP